jgi:hypothetical protein
MSKPMAHSRPSNGLSVNTRTPSFPSVPGGLVMRGLTGGAPSPSTIFPRPASPSSQQRSSPTVSRASKRGSFAGEEKSASPEDAIYKLVRNFPSDVQHDILTHANFLAASVKTSNLVIQKQRVELAEILESRERLQEELALIEQANEVYRGRISDLERKCATFKDYADERLVAAIKKQNAMDKVNETNRLLVETLDAFGSPAGKVIAGLVNRPLERDGEGEGEPTVQPTQGNAVSQSIGTGATDAVTGEVIDGNDKTETLNHSSDHQDDPNAISSSAANTPSAHHRVVKGLRPQTADVHSTSRLSRAPPGARASSAGPHGRDHSRSHSPNRGGTGGVTFMSDDQVDTKKLARLRDVKKISEGTRDELTRVALLKMTRERSKLTKRIGVLEGMIKDLHGKLTAAELKIRTLQIELAEFRGTDNGMEFAVSFSGVEKVWSNNVSFGPMDELFKVSLYGKKTKKKSRYHKTYILSF